MFPETSLIATIQNGLLVPADLSLQSMVIVENSKVIDNMILMTKIKIFQIYNSILSADPGAQVLVLPLHIDLVCSANEHVTQRVIFQLLSQ